MAGDFALYVLISTSVTRITAVLLLIFGAQVLINFYRYNLRLAAFYESRADAIELLGAKSLDNLAPIVASLSPEVIDLGKVPKTPTQEITELAKSLSEIRK